MTDFHDLNQQKHESQTKFSDRFNPNNASHPRACILTLIFKALAFVIYLAIGIILNDYVTYLLTIALAVTDFFIVKMHTGRQLVNLDWWSHIKEKGFDVWLPEQGKNGEVPHKVDKTIFWGAQIAAPLIWGILAIVNLLTLSPLKVLVCVICGGLLVINFISFMSSRSKVKQALDAKKSIQTK